MATAKFVVVEQVFHSLLRTRYPTDDETGSSTSAERARATSHVRAMTPKRSGSAMVRGQRAEVPSIGKHINK